MTALRTCIRFRAEDVENAARLKRHTGLPTMTAVVRYALDSSVRHEVTDADPETDAPTAAESPQVTNGEE